MNGYTDFYLFNGAYYGLYAWNKNTLLVISVSTSAVIFMGKIWVFADIMS